MGIFRYTKKVNIMNTRQLASKNLIDILNFAYEKPRSAQIDKPKVSVKGKLWQAECIKTKELSTKTKTQK